MLYMLKKINLLLFTFSYGFTYFFAQSFVSPKVVLWTKKAGKPWFGC